MLIKLWCKFLVTISVLLALNSVYADYQWVASPYLGGEYKLSFSKGHDSWKKILPVNQLLNNGTAFMGLRIYDVFSGEVGYTKSRTRTKWSNTNGEYMFGTLATSSNAIQSINLSYRNWYLDFNLHYPGNDSFSLLANIGISSFKPTFDLFNLGSSNNINITTIEGKAKLVPHFGLGMQYIRGRFGVRTKIVWENTERGRVDIGKSKLIYPGIKEKPFNSTYAWSVGAFMIVD